MNLVLLGNVFSFMGAVIMVAIGLVRKKEHILYAQCVQFGLMGVGNFLLGGVSGFVANLVSILRNALGLKIKFDFKWKIMFVALQAFMTLLVNRAGLIGWLPFAATGLFTLFLDTKSDIVIKLVIIAGLLFWAVYDFTISNYASLTFDVLSFITSTVGIITLCRERRQNIKKAE